MATARLSVPSVVGGVRTSAFSPPDVIAVRARGWSPAHSAQAPGRSKVNLGPIGITIDSHSAVIRAPLPPNTEKSEGLYKFLRVQAAQRRQRDYACHWIFADRVLNMRRWRAGGIDCDRAVSGKYITAVAKAVGQGDSQLTGRPGRGE